MVGELLEGRVLRVDEDARETGRWDLDMNDLWTGISMGTMPYGIIGYYEILWDINAMV